MTDVRCPRCQSRNVRVGVDGVRYCGALWCGWVGVDMTARDEWFEGIHEDDADNLHLPPEQ